MIDKFCDYLTNKIRKEIPDIDDERAEVINYGLQILIGEIPKIFIMAGLAAILGVLKWTMICFFVLLPYRKYSGGFHLKTHIGCTVATSLMYTGNAWVSAMFQLTLEHKILVALLIFVFAIFMIYKYAPADTENVPIVSKKERRKNRIISYILVVIMTLTAILSSNYILSNILLIGILVQTLSITRIAYKITKNKYGYEEYMKQKDIVIN